MVHWSIVHHLREGKRIFMSTLEEAMQEVAQRNAFTVYNHMEFEAAEIDRVVFRMEVRPEGTNGYGMVHGGALYALADNAAGCAVHTDGRNYVTQSGTLNFLANQDHGVIRAEGRVRRRGRRTALAAVDLTGEGGKLLATGEFLYYCVSESL